VLALPYRSLSLHLTDFSSSMIGLQLEKYKGHLKHEGLTHPRGNEPEFTIAHYAGQVTYHVDGFLDKNRDTLAVDLIAVMRLR
jgi:myosin-3